MFKNPVLQFVAWSFLLCQPVFAREAIQIEIDNAPVEVEIQKPKPIPRIEAPGTSRAPEVSQAPPEAGKSQTKEKNKRTTGVAVGIGLLVAGALAALAGGGGGGSGGGSAPSH